MGNFKPIIVQRKKRKKRKKPPDSIYIRLGTKHPCVKGIQCLQINDISTFNKGDKCSYLSFFHPYYGITIALSICLFIGTVSQVSNVTNEPLVDEYIYMINHTCTLIIYTPILDNDENVKWTLTHSIEKIPGKLILMIMLSLIRSQSNLPITIKSNILHQFEFYLDRLSCTAYMVSVHCVNEVH